MEIEEFRAASKFRADPASPAACSPSPTPARRTTTAARSSSARTASSTSATGDGGGADDTDNSAQRPNSLLGKLLRIDPRRSGGDPYTVPRSNPFAAAPGATRSTRSGSATRSASPSTGDAIVIGDVGQNKFEEIDYETLGNANGANFGWNDFEGFARSTVRSRPGRAATTGRSRPTASPAEPAP